MWHITQIGSGRVRGKQLTVPAVRAEAYHDAQIADYTLQDRVFRWRPPVTMTIRARFSTPDVRGTAGFGFWNHPFSPEMRGIPRLPQAAWYFFGSPPNDMPLAMGVPGHGWKCATLDATRPGFLALVPFTLPGILLMRVPLFYRALWPVGQAALGVSEALLDTSYMAEAHDYTLEWQRDGLRFLVDGETVHESPHSPRGPLGFIAWIDNQYAIVSPKGHFGWGLVDVPQAQTLSLESIDIR